MLLKGGLTAKLATLRSPRAASSFPARTVLFDDATAGVIGPAAQSAGLTLRRVATAPPARGHRQLAADRRVRERRRLGKRLVAAGPRLHRRPGRHDGAERRIDPLVTYDVVFSTANFLPNTPANATARARLAAFFASAAASAAARTGQPSSRTARGSPRGNRRHPLRQRARQPCYQDNTGGAATVTGAYPTKGHGHRRPADLVHGRSVRLVDRRQPADHDFFIRGALADRRRVGVPAPRAPMIAHGTARRPGLPG